MLVISLALLTMRSTIPDLSPDQWNSLDLELCRLQGELHHDLGMEILPAHEAGDVYTMMLVDFLSSKPEFQQEAPRYFIHSPPRSLDQAREEKNRLRKKLNKKDATAEDRRLFQQALKYYSFTLAKSKENAEDAKRTKHEKLFRTKFYKFAKAACNGTLDQDPVGPTFSKETADIFFPGRYSTAVPIDPAKLSWFPPAPPPTSAYAVTLFTPSLVKSILKGRKATTAPGEDGLMFGVLSKLPSSHHFLATLYNKVDEQTIAPTSWTGCKIVLSHKDGSTEEPSNFRPLALASILGKIYHQVKAGKMTDFMIENGYIDPATQKAFMQNINGCVEHIQVIQELIQDAKASNKTLHATFFDLLDCFGSISHQLIQFCLEHYHVPEKERSYILSLYSQLHGKVVTKEWESEPFKFLKGVYQGDNYSAIIFLVVFQPLISYLLSHKESSGYMLGERKIITKPFADDFECLTRNKKTHQKLMLDLQVKAKAMGLTFKPSKCRTLSIQGGTVKPCSFYLLDKDSVQTPLATLEDDPTKFLGSSLTHQNTPADHHKFLQAKLESKLSNLDKVEVRGEYKVAVYMRYALPSLWFHLSVHNIHKTHLAQLDATARRYIKQWLDFPSRGASDISLFHPGIIGLKHPSKLYLEGHLGAHIQSSILGGPDTQETIKNRLACEWQWTKKSFTTRRCSICLIWTISLPGCRKTLATSSLSGSRCQPSRRPPTCW